MFTIIALFDVSFILRAILDIHTLVPDIKVADHYCEDAEGRRHICKPYKLCLFGVVMQIVYDYIPLMAILLFHKSNFKVKTVVKDYSALEKEDVDATDEGTEVNIHRETLLENEVLIRESLMRSRRTGPSNTLSVNKQTSESFTGKSGEDELLSNHENQETNALLGMSADLEVMQFESGLFTTAIPARRPTI